MPQKWYESRTNQGAVIGGIAVVLAAGVAGFLARPPRPDLTGLEIQTRQDGAAETIARLALVPERTFVDSAAFRHIGASLVVLSDTLGIAIQRPREPEWTTGEIGPSGNISVLNVPAYGSSVEFWMKLLGSSDLPVPRTFGVRQDLPVRIKFDDASSIDGMKVGDNPYDDVRVLDRTIRAISGDAPMPSEERDMARREIKEYMDSLIQRGISRDTLVHTGVFITPITRTWLEASEFGVLSRGSLLDDVVALAVHPFIRPTFLYVDRDNGRAAFNLSSVIRNAWVDNARVSEAVVNRAGYILQTGPMVYIITLQYVSTQDQRVLDEMQKMFESVRLRTSRGTLN